MKTIKCEFLSEGDRVKRTAILSDDLSTLSKSKKNQALDTMDLDGGEKWVIIFDGTDYTTLEVEFELVNGQRTLNAIDAKTWNDKGIDIDVEKVSVTIK